MADTFQERFTGQPDEVVQGQEGLLQTVPKAFELGSKLLTGLAKEPGNLVQGLLDFFKAPGKAFSQGVSPEEEISFGFNAALGTVGAGTFKPPKGLVDAATAFHEQVTKPAAERLVSNPDAVSPPMGTDVPANVTRSELAQTGNPHIDTVLNSPVTKSVIDNPVVNRKYDVPYTAGGSVPLENPEMFIDRNFPRAISVDGKTFDPADPFIVHENYEQHKMDILTKGGMSNDEAYRVAHWEAEQAEGAWYKSHGIDQEKAEAIYKPLLRDDQAAPATSLPPNLYTRPYPHDAPMAARDEPFVGTERPSAGEQSRANAITEAWQNKPPEEQTQPIQPAPVNPLQEARDLGVIGPERLPHPEDTPAQAAQRAIPASRRLDPNDKITMTPGGEDIGSYQKYFADWVGKIKHPGDIDNLIMRAAKEQNFFEDVRFGDNREVPAAHIAELAKVTGFDAAKFDAKALRTRFTTDNEFRTAAQIMFQARDDAVAGFEKARNASTPEDWDAAADTFNRFKIALKYMRRFSNDWNKTGRAQQEILDTEKRQTQYKDRAREGVPKGVNDLVAATEELDRAPSKSALDKLLGTIEAAEKEVAPPAPVKEGQAPKPQLPPELGELVKTARAVADLMNVKRPEPSGVDTVRPLRAIVVPREPMPKNALASFNRLLSQAERTAGPKQEAIQRAASKQFPPDLQALIDKAEFVTKRFGGIARERAEAQAAAEATAGLDKEGLAYVVGRAQEMAKTAAEYTDKMFWLRNNWLLSGPITHTFYFAINSGTAIADHVLNPLVAAAIDRVMGGRNVFFGESGAGAFGLVHAVPGAFRAGMTAARTGLRVPLESELRLAERGEESPQARGSNIPYLAHASPDWGALKSFADALGVPMKARNAAELMAGGGFGRFANMQHTIFKVLNEGAMAHRNAYVATVKEGLSPLKDAEFADRYKYHLKNPTDDVLRDNINAGYEGTFMQKLGPKTQRFASALKDTPLRWEFPFMHVPINLTRKGVSFTPLAYFGPEMRAKLMGEKGARTQATALASVGIGTALLSYITQQATQGNITSDYPKDAKERARWKADNIQPNSFKWGDQWESYGRFGPARIPIAIGALLGDTITHYDTTKSTDEEMAAAVGKAIVGTVNIMSDEVGMIAMHNFMEMMNDERGLAKYGAGEVASFLPYNVGLGQLAAFNDPYAREAKGFMDNIRYRIPYLRETLMPKRDALYGEPIPNPAYHTFVRSSPATPDPVKMELDRIGYHPGAPKAEISKVKLTPEQFDKYEATAGPLVKRGLNEMYNDPAYKNLDTQEQNKQMRGVVKYFRGKARETMQIDEPQTIIDGTKAAKAQLGLH